MRFWTGVLFFAAAALGAQTWQETPVMVQGQVYTLEAYARELFFEVSGLREWEGRSGAQVLRDLWDPQKPRVKFLRTPQNPGAGGWVDLEELRQLLEVNWGTGWVPGAVEDRWRGWVRALDQWIGTFVPGSSGALGLIPGPGPWLGPWEAQKSDDPRVQDLGHRWLKWDFLCRKGSTAEADQVLREIWIRSEALHPGYAKAPVFQGPGWRLNLWGLGALVLGGLAFGVFRSRRGLFWGLGLGALGCGVGLGFYFWGGPGMGFGLTLGGLGLFSLGLWGVGKPGWLGRGGFWAGVLGLAGWAAGLGVGFF